MSIFINDLNKVQQEAVKNTEGPVLVIAGAGSGKTRVLTYRIAYLLDKGIPAHHILALTFTNKAAKEMKNRIAQLVGEEVSRYLWMGTFHSVFARILRKEHELCGFPPSYTIYDTDDSKSLIKTIIQDLNLDDQAYPPTDILRRISMAKNQLITAESYKTRSELVEADRSSRRPEISNIYEAYSRRCKQAGAMDFDDLLVNTFILFRNNPMVLGQYQQQFRYLLVDEYQDTNFAQYSIVKQLGDANKNVCVVGDDSQSIYSFRGAKIENILNFRNDYPDYQVFKLEQNYRSTKNIVEAANSLIANNQGRIPKKIWSDNEEGDPIGVYEAVTDQEEGFYIANSVLETHLRDRASFTEFAILYRTHAQSRILEEACRKNNIPYRIYGSISFYQRKEIKDILAYFRVMVNPADDESLRRVINYPARGIGKTTIDRLNEAAYVHRVPIWHILQDPGEYSQPFNAGTIDKLIKFRELISKFMDIIGTSSAYNLAVNLLETTGIANTFRHDKTPEGISKFENIEELVNGIREFVDDTETEEGAEQTMGAFLQNVALLTDQDNDTSEDRNRVSLMTIHSAKGLEFKYVYIAGVEEDLFPNQFSVYSSKDLEEERRLFYVAMTRAMNRAVITYSRTRYRWGNLTDCQPSRFIKEIDPRYLQLPSGKTIPSPTRQRSSSSDPSLSRGKPLTTPPLQRIRVKSLRKDPIDFEPDDPEKIMNGMEVEHARFGLGKVLKIEGTSPNKKATVFFRESGQKQLLLRFARLRIVDRTPS